MKKKTERAFSLVEVTLALAVMVFGLVTLLALIPLGLTTANSAISDTRTSLIAQDAALRIRTITAFTPGSSNALTETWWYDMNGRLVTTNSTSGGPSYTNALYRVDASRAPLNSYPTNTSPAQADPANTYSTELMAAVITVGSPVNQADGTLPSGTASTNTYTFYVRPVPNL